MVEMKLTRRDFIKSNAVAAAATVAGISVPGMVAAQGRDDGVRVSRIALGWARAAADDGTGRRLALSTVVSAERGEQVGGGASAR